MNTDKGFLGYRAPAVVRAIALLEFVAGRTVPPTFMELVRALEVSKSTLHGLLGTLGSVGWIGRSDDGAGYSLGPAAVDFARQRPNHRALLEVAEPLMEELADQIGETVFLGLPEGDDVIVQLVAGGGLGMGISSRPGVRLPILAPAFGRVVFAEMDAAEGRRYLEAHTIPRFSERSPADVASYMCGVETARKTGYAHDDEEFIPGARAIAVPIVWDSRIIALLWVAAFASHLPAEAVETTARGLLAVAQNIGEMMLSPVRPLLRLRALKARSFR